MAYIEKKKKRQNRKGLVKVEERQKIYQSTLWRKMRLQQFSEHPLCQICEAEGKVKAGEHVHHVRSFVNAPNLVERDRLAYDPDNLMTLCEECHGKIHSGSAEAQRVLSSILKNREK